MGNVVKNGTPAREFSLQIKCNKELDQRKWSGTLRCRGQIESDCTLESIINGDESLTINFLKILKGRKNGDLDPHIDAMLEVLNNQFIVDTPTAREGASPPPARRSRRQTRRRNQSKSKPSDNGTSPSNANGNGDGDKGVKWRTKEKWNQKAREVADRAREQSQKRLDERLQRQQEEAKEAEKLEKMVLAAKVYQDKYKANEDILRIQLLEIEEFTNRKPKKTKFTSKKTKFTDCQEQSVEILKDGRLKIHWDIITKDEDGEVQGTETFDRTCTIDVNKANWFKTDKDNKFQNKIQDDPEGNFEVFCSFATKEAENKKGRVGIQFSSCKQFKKFLDRIDSHHKIMRQGKKDHLGNKTYFRSVWRLLDNYLPGSARSLRRQTMHRRRYSSNGTNLR